MKQVMKSLLTLPATLAFFIHLEISLLNRPLEKPWKEQKKMSHLRLDYDSPAHAMVAR